MKTKIKLILALIVVVFASCKTDINNNSNIESIIKEVSVLGNDEDYTHLFEELLAKKALSNEQLLEAFPKKLGSLELDNGQTEMGNPDSTVSGSVITGNFGNNTIKMVVTDAVGNYAGVAINNIKSYNLLHLESDENTKYLKKERNGIKTSGVYTTVDNQSELKFVFDNRFYITVEAKGMTVDELWDILNVNISLKRFKEFNK